MPKPPLGNKRNSRKPRPSTGDAAKGAGAKSDKEWRDAIRIAVNEVLGWQRREGRRGDHLELFEERIESNDAASAAADVEARLELERAVKRLPEGARNVFVLTGLYGHSHEETAEMLGIAVGTSKAQLHRARRLLAEQLEL